MPDQSLTTQVTASTEVAHAPQVVSVVQAPAGMPWDKAAVAAGELGGAAVAVAGLVALIHRAMTREVKRDVADVSSKVAELRHSVRNNSGKIDALEHLRANDEARFARLETSAMNVEKTLDRIEGSQRSWFDKLEASIREIRHVSPRG